MTWTSISGLAAIVFGAAFAYQAYVLPRATVGNPMGPVLYPIILGCGLGIFGIILTVEEFIRLRKTGGEGRIRSMKITVFGRNIAIVATLCAGYAFLFERVGYVLSTFLFLGTVLLLFNGFKRWKLGITLSVAFSVGVYFLFSTVLAIPLPRMPFFDI